jgi:serine/threonine-protein kinase HipA
MADFEVHIELDGRTRPVGLARSNRVRGTETVLFEYAAGWLDDPERFSLEPALTLTRGAFAPPAGQATFGSIGDSAPDTWGRRLMQRAERRLAEREGRPVRTLAESDYLLGVADETRLGALRFRWAGEEVFQAPIRAGVPALIDLGRLLQITERILRDEETDEDLQLIFAPGSSLGGARPKASVTDQHGRLSIAKFPKETDDYSMETWEEIALRLAGRAGIATPDHELIEVAGKAVLLSRRFDRAGAVRIPFLSAMAMMGAKDGERGSYPEIVDALVQHGAQGKTDAHALYRRVVFNVLISNVDDHLRNHGLPPSPTPLTRRNGRGYCGSKRNAWSPRRMWWRPSRGRLQAQPRASAPRTPRLFSAQCSTRPGWRKRTASDTGAPSSRPLMTFWCN